MTVLLPLISGIFVSLQAALNGNLGKKVGTIESTYLSFFTGSIFLSIVVIVLGDGNIFKITEAPPWQWICAIFGLIFVFVLAFSSPKIGVTATTTTIVIGQLAASMMIDHFGWFASDVTPFSMKRLAGIILMIGALYFIFKEQDDETKQVSKKAI